MQLCPGPDYFNFRSQAASLRVADRRLAGSEHLGVRDNSSVGAKSTLVSFYKRQQVGAADFFLAFEDTLHIYGQCMCGAQIRLQRLYMAEQLPFIVSGAAGVEIESLYGRRKGWCAPLSYRLAGENIVMPVNDQGRTVCRA